MESFGIPVPSPSAVFVGNHGALRAARRRLRDAIMAASFDAARGAADDYALLFDQAEAGGARSAGSVWRFPDSPAVCSFDAEFEKGMIRDTRIALCMRSAATCSQRDPRCVMLAEALGMCRSERAAGKAILVELLIHAEYIDSAPVQSASAWRAVHERAVHASRCERTIDPDKLLFYSSLILLRRMMTADGDRRGVQTADAIAADALARACEAAAEARFSVAQFMEAARLAAAGRDSFRDRARQLAAVAEDRGMAIGSQSATELLDLLPAAASLPAL